MTRRGGRSVGWWRLSQGRAGLGREREERTRGTVDVALSEGQALTLSEWADAGGTWKMLEWVDVVDVKKKTRGQMRRGSVGAYGAWTVCIQRDSSPSPQGSHFHKAHTYAHTRPEPSLGRTVDWTVHHMAKFSHGQQFRLSHGQPHHTWYPVNLPTVDVLRH